MDSIIHWLQDRAALISQFVDHVPHPPRNASLDQDLRAWLNNPDWSAPGERFDYLGYDGTGSMFVTWTRGEAPAAVAYLGSEGSRGVLARSLRDWVDILAHAPHITEHPQARPAPLADTLTGKERSALEAFRRARDARFGPAPAWEALVEPLAPLNAAFCGWVEQQIRTFTVRDMDTYKLNGAPGAAARRRALAARLDIKGGNARALLKRLNAEGISRADVEQALRELDG